jgi:O-antigen/teichoic acid export membrane protein
MVKKNLIANYIGQVWVGLMGFIFAPLYITIVGVEAYGLIGIFALLQAWLSLLDMGMTPTLGREMARFKAGTHSRESIRDLLRSIEIIAILIAAVMSCSSILGANWMATSWLKPDELPVEMVIQAFSVMGLVIGLRFVEGVYRSAIVGLQRQVIFNVVSSVMATFRWGGAAGILIWVSPTIKAFFVWQLIVSSVTLSILSYITYKTIPHGNRSGRFSFDELRTVSKFAGGMLGINFLSLLLTQVDKTILSTLISLTEFSYYTLAATVAGTLFMFTGPVTQAFYPKFCEMHASGDKDGLSSSYHMGAQLIAVSAGSAAIVLIFFSETFLRLWTQDSLVSEKVAPLVSVLVLGNLLNGLMLIPYQAQLACGWTKLALYTNLVAVIIIIPALIFLAKYYGAIGAAWVWAVLNAGYVCIAVQFMYKKILLGEKWKWYKLDVFIPLLPSALVVFILSKLLEPLKTSSIGQIISLVLALGVAITISIISAPRVRYFILKEFRKI